MIHAVLRNKLNREIFITKEDTLTSSIIGLLILLPSADIWNILSNACYEKELPETIGKFIDAEFWPRWDSRNTENKKYVEPDVFMQFENADIIIEAKRYDEKQQISSEWEKEIIAYFNEYKDKKDILFFAIGGINTTETEIIKHQSKETKIYKISWGKILYEVEIFIYNKQKKRNKKDKREINDNPTIRILELIKLAFELHGYISTKWFCNLKLKTYKIKSYTKELNTWNPY